MKPRSLRLAQKRAQVVRFGGRDAALAAAQMRRQIVEVVAVGGERVLAGAALGRLHVEEQLDQPIVGCRRPAGHGSGVTAAA